MPNLISKLRFERLRKLLSGASAESGQKPAKVELWEVQEAVALAEAMICDMVAHCAGEETPGFQAQGNGFSSVNAFGRQVVSVELPSVAEGIASGAGMGMSGLRSSVFLPGDHLSEGYAQLQSLARRHVPLVVHAAFREGFGAGSSHTGYHGASDLGLFQVMPTSVQQAVDLTILARWLAERSLIPGIVAFDRRVCELAAFPSIDTIREFLGAPDEEFASPSPAQMLLFGGNRPVVPGWFDPDLPVSFGSLQGTNDAVSAAVGSQAFFAGHLSELLKDGMSRLGRLTGRPLSMIEQDGVDQANFVVVTQGSAFETVRAAARYLRQEKKMSVGVLGVTWLRPFPTAALREALSNKRGIAILECSTAGLAEEGTLMREVRRAVPTADANWISASFGLHGQPLGVSEVIELASELKEKQPRSRMWLGVVSGSSRIGDFPKREGLVKSVASDYPDLSATTLPGALTEKVSAKQLRTVQWIGSSELDPAEVMRKLVGTCQETGAKVRGFGWFPEPGILSVRVSAGPEDLPIAESGTSVDVLLLGRLGLDLIYNPLADLKAAQAVIIESDRTAQELWGLMPEFWRSEVRRLNLRLYKVEKGLEQLVAGAAALLSGTEVPGTEIAWKSLDEPAADLEDVPQLVRRAGEAKVSYANLPRFWGEVMQPKRGGISENFPDPLVTVGAVPSYTAALARPRGTALPSMPVLEADKCTGCGRCWPVCPDSAIGASLIGLQEYLDSAADAVGGDGKIAAAMKRAHRPLATRIAALAKQKGAKVLTSELLDEAYESVVAKMSVSEEERPHYDASFRSTAEVATRLSPVICDSFFGKAEEEAKGSGRLLLLAFNPDACQGCQLCISNCPENALVAYDRAGTVREDARLGWKVWEQLPDTPGPAIEKAESELELGRLAARLLSRHSSQVQAVGSFGEPGSGERLACRTVAGLVEAQFQQRLSDQAQTASELSGRLNDMVQKLLAKSLTEADSKSIQDALETLPRHRVSLSDLSERLSKLGQSAWVDPVKTLRLAQVAHELQTEAWNLSEGVNRLGRSRFGVVVISHRIARWAGRFPNHPYNAPLVVEPSPEGAGLAIGLAEAQALKHVDQVRRVRKARLLLENPSDLPGRLATLEDLTWTGLSQEERASCAPLLVLADESALTRQGLGALTRLLTGDLPVKLVLLDSRPLSLENPEPALLGLGLKRAFVLSGSLGYARHLADGLEKAMGQPGPALVHIHVPIPQEQGFEPIETLDRAKLAVQARVQPLLTYDPRAEGVFGLRLSLEGNPALESEWAGSDPVQWAFGEGRFSSLFSLVSNGERTVPWEEYLRMDETERQNSIPAMTDSSGKTWKIDQRLASFAERRLEVWNTLREMSGVVSPFIERIRTEAEQTAEAENQKKFESMKSTYESEIEHVRQEGDRRMAEQLRQRLLTLAGFGSGDSETGDRE
ncbi:MAG: 4Fe-4S binding protein [Acidobacteriota bacterium]